MSEENEAASSETEQVSRTQLAEDRTILANERTFAGWMRTSLGCIGIGVGFHALFFSMRPEWLPRAIVTAFLLLAVIVIVLAERRACSVLKRLNPHVVVTARRVNLRLFAVCISVCSFALIAAIWFAEVGP